MQLSEFIIQNMEEILKEWESFAQTLPSGKSMGTTQLRDHAKQILETIAEGMDAAQCPAEQKFKSKGKGRLMKLPLKFAIKHADERHEEGFDIDEVISEYRALRASVIHLWTRKMKSADKETLYELIRFNEEVDQALTYCVEEFSRVTEKNRVALLIKLKQADKQKDEFLAILAHELRNPLAPIQTGIEVLRLMQDIPTAAETPVNMMERQMANLLRLVDDLLDISRIKEGKLNLCLEKADISDIIRMAVEATASFVYAGQRKVSIELHSEPLLVHGDAVRLVQIMGNLLSNAGKHTDEHGHIEVSVKRDGQQAKIVVRDDGAGIAPEKINNLFKKFQQLNATRRDGLGIGLWLAHKLVKLHGGSITGSSEGLGRGSEFAVYLPLLHGGHLTSLAQKEKDITRLDALKVLVVDDKRDVARSLEMLLQLLGAQPRLAHDGSSALALLEAFRPDLVLLDIGLPDMDGYEVASRMRKHAAGKSAKIVIVSGWDRGEDCQQSLQAGIDEYLVKPINLQDIARVMGSLKLK